MGFAQFTIFCVLLNFVEVHAISLYRKLVSVAYFQDESPLTLDQKTIIFTEKKAGIKSSTFKRLSYVHMVHWLIII